MAPIGPLASIALGLVGNVAYDRYKDWKAKKASAGPSLPTPNARAGAAAPMTPAQVALFTQRDPDGRRLMFDPPKARILRQALAFRCVVPHVIDASPLSTSLPCWRVVPPQPGLLSAQALLDHASENGGTVLGSLELVHAANPLSTNTNMLLVVGGPALSALAEPGRGFAWLGSEQKPAPSPQPAPTPPPEEPKPAPAPAAPEEDATEPVVPASAKNGTSHHAVGKATVSKIKPTAPSA